MKLMINESNEDFDIELYDSLYDYCDDIKAELNKYSGKEMDSILRKVMVLLETNIRKCGLSIMTATLSQLIFGLIL